MRASFGDEFIGRIGLRDPLWCLLLVTSLSISLQMITHGGSLGRSQSRVLHILGLVLCVCVDFMNCCVVLDLLADFATLELHLFGRVYWLLFCNVSDL